MDLEKSSPVPLPSHGLRSVLDAVCTSDPEGMLLALQATGMEMIQALGLIYETGDPACACFAVDSLVKDWTEEIPAGSAERITIRFAEIGEKYPSLTDAAMKSYFEGDMARKVLHGTLKLGWSGMGYLPSGLQVDGNVAIQGATRLEEFPPGWKVDGWLRIMDCPELKRIGGGTTAEWNMTAQDCPKLETMPDDLKVGGFLEIRKCPNCRIHDGFVPPDGIFRDGPESMKAEG